MSKHRTKNGSSSCTVYLIRGTGQLAMPDPDNITMALTCEVAAMIYLYDNQ